MSSPLTRRSLLQTLAVGLAGRGFAAQPATPTVPPPIEEELVLETPVSRFIVDGVLKAFAAHAKERWGIGVRTNARSGGTPVVYGRIVDWKGKPEADVFWGGEPALFDKLAEKKLLAKHEVPAALADAVPASIGKPKPIALKDPEGYWIGTALEAYGLVYHPRLLRRLGLTELKAWDDLLDPRLKGNLVQCAPTRSSSSHASYEVVLQSRGEPAGWEWLRRLAANTGLFTTRSRDVPSVVAKGEFAAGFGVPSYMAFEEAVAGFDLRFAAPSGAFVTPEPLAVLAGARHPKVARAFVEFLLSEKGQRVFMERGLFPIVPRYKVQGPPGSVVEKAVEFTGGRRSYFDGQVVNHYDENVAQKRYQDVNERFRADIEAPWEGQRKKS